ncbi:meiotic nuclear division protein 1 [Bisporella sp. PMI_857]|nr:meiotic nuclear division protein 1 [Bisporella sp. PMI_857]
MGVYSLKELEKLQTLHDEKMIRIEKIGSGNWYWSFKSDAKKQKEVVLHNLKAEENKLVAFIAETERQIEEEKAKRNEDDETLEGGMGKKALLDVHATLWKESEALDKELALYSQINPAEVARRVEETNKLKECAIRWTDRIECLESLLAELTGDRNTTAEVMKSACGDEYVIGEGLVEL